MYRESLQYRVSFPGYFHTYFRELTSSVHTYRESKFPLEKLPVPLKEFTAIDEVQHWFLLGLPGTFSADLHYDMHMYSAGGGLYIQGSFQQFPDILHITSF